MNIGLDMDGVLKHINLAELKLCEGIGDYEAFTIHRTTQGYPLLNPALIALQDDEIYVITNCSSEKMAEQKQRWLTHFYGDRLKLAPVFRPINAWGRDYVDPVASAKLEKCHELDIKVYFDDDPAIIRRMREIHEANFKRYRYMVFMKYGPWIEEIY